MTTSLTIEGQVTHNVSIGSSSSYNLRLDDNKFTGFSSILVNPIDYGRPINNRLFLVPKLSIIYARMDSSKRVSISYFYSKYDDNVSFSNDRIAPVSRSSRHIDLSFGLKQFTPKKNIEVWPMIGIGYQLTFIGIVDRSNERNTSRKYKGWDINMSINCQFSFYKSFYLTGDIGLNHNLSVKHDTLRIYVGLGYRI